MSDPTPAQVAQAEKILSGWMLSSRREYIVNAVAAALATAVAEKEAELSARVESAKFDAMVAEGERICNRVFAELPLDANVSDGNESADPADHIVPCVRAALATAHAEGRQAGERLQAERILLMQAVDDARLSDATVRTIVRDVLSPEPVTEADIAWAEETLRRLATEARP